MFGDDERARAGFDDGPAARDQLGGVAIHTHRQLVASASDNMAHKTLYAGASKHPHSLHAIVSREPHIKAAVKQRYDAAYAFLVREGDEIFTREHPLTRAILMGVAPHSRRLTAPNRILRDLFGTGATSDRKPQYEATTVCGSGALPEKESIPVTEMVQSANEWAMRARKVLKAIQIGYLMGTFKRATMTGRLLPTQGLSARYQPMRAFHATNQTDVSAIYWAAYALHATCRKIQQEHANIMENEMRSFYTTGNVMAMPGLPTGSFADVLGADRMPPDGVDAMMNSAAVVEDQMKKSPMELREQLKARFESKIVRDKLQQMEECEGLEYGNLMLNFTVGEDQLTYLEGLLNGPHGGIVRGLMDSGQTAERTQALPEENVFHASLYPIKHVVQNHTWVANAQTLAKRKWAEIPEIVSQRTDTSEGGYLYHPGALMETRLPFPLGVLKHIAQHKLTDHIDYYGAGEWRVAPEDDGPLARYVPHDNVLGFAPSSESVELAVSYKPRDRLVCLTWLAHKAFNDAVIERLQTFLRPCEACLFVCTHMLIKRASMKDTSFWVHAYHNSAIGTDAYHEDLTIDSPVVRAYDKMVRSLDFESKNCSRARSRIYQPAETRFERVARENEAAIERGEPHAVQPMPTEAEDLVDIVVHIKKQMRDDFVAVTNPAWSARFEFYYRFVAAVAKPTEHRRCHICCRAVATNFRSKLFKNRTICHPCYIANTVGTQLMPHAITASMKRKWPALDRANWIGLARLFLPVDTHILGQVYPPTQGSARARPNAVLGNPLGVEAKAFDPLHGTHFVVNKIDLERLVNRVEPYTKMLREGKSVDCGRIFATHNLFTEQPRIHTCSFFYHRGPLVAGDHSDGGEGLSHSINTDLFPRHDRYTLNPHVPSSPAQPQEGIFAYFRDAADDEDNPQAVLKSGVIVDCRGATVRVKYDARAVGAEVPWPVVHNRHVITQRFKLDLPDTRCDIIGTHELLPNVWACESCMRRFYKSGYPARGMKRRAEDEASSVSSQEAMEMVEAAVMQEDEEWDHAPFTHASAA